MKYYAEVESNGNVRNWFDWDDEKYPTEPNIEGVTMIDITSLPENKRSLIGYKYDRELKRFKKNAVLDGDGNIIKEESIIDLP